MSDQTTPKGSGAAARPTATGKIKAQAVNLGQRLMGWALLAPGETVRWAQGLSRSTLGWGALALGGLLFLSLNLSASVLLRDTKVDLTEEQLYTISGSTKRMLANLDEPISVNVYYSRRLGEVAPLFARHFERLKGLLEQYRDLSGGKLQVAFIDPEPFSDAEDRASASGLKGQRLNQDGETAYFGLVASNTTDNDAVVPFFSPDRERFLEYDITKLINGLANPKKRVVGLISGVQLDGGQNPMNPRAPPTQPWMVMEQIRDFFEVRTLELSVTEIPKDIDVLMVVQPTVLPEAAAYAIDQYALGGGRVLAFVDPVSEATPPGPMSLGALPVSKDFRNVLKAWGLEFDTTKIVGDPAVARRVQFGGPGGEAVVTDYLAWLQIDKSQLNEKDPLAASIRLLNLATAGALKKTEGATTIIQPLIQSSPQSGLIDSSHVRSQPDPLAVARAFKTGGTPLILAARIGGEAKSAFPDGRPKAKDEAAAAADGKAGDAAAKPAGEAAAATPAAAKDGKAGDARGAAQPDKSHLAAGRVNIVVVGDSDLLADHFWVDVREFLGQKVAIPQADNAGFVVNALENLSGGEALADLRGRGVVDRPFERVTEIRRDAERRFRQKEEALNAKLKDLQTQLARVETKGGDGTGKATVILSEPEKQAIEKFRGEMIAVRRELRDVKAALRRDIDQLDGWLKFLNIGLVPLLIGLGGLGLGLARRRGRNGA